MRNTLLIILFCIEAYFLIEVCFDIVGRILFPHRDGDGTAKRPSKMRKKLYFICCCITAIGLLGTACTHDYFDDETNYQVFVPEVLDGTISDCRILVYNSAGALAGERYAAAPFDQNTRFTKGLFGFKLPPGKYAVYCYINTGGVSFSDHKTLSSASFSTLRAEEEPEEHAYMQPDDMFWQKLNPDVPFSSFLKTDTASITRYVGKVTVRFKNFPHPVTDIAQVRLCASDIATVQPLQADTLTSRHTDMDCMVALNSLKPLANEFEVQNLYLPSIDGVMMDLRFRFLGNTDQIVAEMPVEVSDKISGQPLRLISGQHMVIEVDGYTIVRVSVIGWNEHIEGGETDIQ